MKKAKRNIVIAAVLVFVCAAVYLNWSYNRSEDVSPVSEDAAGRIREASIYTDIYGSDHCPVGLEIDL